MEEEIYEIPELDEELNYSFTQREIQKQILKEWIVLKDSIINDAWSYDDLDEFEKLLNYYYD